MRGNLVPDASDLVNTIADCEMLIFGEEAFGEKVQRWLDKTNEIGFIPYPQDRGFAKDCFRQDASLLARYFVSFCESRLLSFFIWAQVSAPAPSNTIGRTAKPGLTAGRQEICRNSFKNVAFAADGLPICQL